MAETKRKRGRDTGAVSILFTEVPPALSQALKRRAKAERRTLRAVVIAALEAYIRATEQMP